MRILFLTNFYPPYEKGGYEQLCQEAVQGLEQKGHTVAVLTSDSGVVGKPRAEARADARTEQGIFRVLQTEVDLRPYRGYLDFFFNRERRCQNTLKRFQEVLTCFRPDGLFVWGMWNLPRELLVLAENWPGLAVAYYIADYWPTLPSAYTLHFQEQPRRGYVRIPKQILSRIALSKERKRRAVPLKFEHVFCVSQAVRRHLQEQPEAVLPVTEAELPFANARVIYNGIDLAPYLAGMLLEQRPLHSPPALLYAGRIAPEKGVRTAIEAVALLKKTGQTVTMTLLGGGSAEYLEELRRLSASLDIAGEVTFQGFIPREQMPLTLSLFDVLVSPSIWPEPLPRIVQEAMAAGVVVVGTTVGGMPEILMDGVNGLTFPAENSRELARCIGRVVEDGALRRRFSEAGRKIIEERFDIRRMVDEMEEQLLSIVSEKNESTVSIPVVSVSTQ